MRSSTFEYGAARNRIRGITVSPRVLFEMQQLQEIGRLNEPPDEFLTILERDFEVRVCPLPFHKIVEASYRETWTRDPFDRFIVSHAKAGGGKLITRDMRIREHFPDAVW